MFPVDLPAVSDTDLTSASVKYLSSLESRQLNSEWFHLSHTSKVAITANNIRQLQLFEDDQPDCLLLALHPPDDPSQVVALYLHEKWWCVEDVLRTSSSSRSGLISVQSMVERVVLFLLSQVVERSSQETAFSLHPRAESCKLLWRDRQAVGFYTIKHKGSLCDSWSSDCYLLPVLDTVLVRRSFRRRGFGLQMLEDFCSSFSTEMFLGVSSPLSPSMAAVCRSFLQQHEEHREHLYEVEAPGGWTQRRNIWLNIKLGRYFLGINEESGPTSGETHRNDGHGSSQKTHSCRVELTSESSCNVDAPLVTGSSAQQMKACDSSRGGISQSSEISGTGCCPAAHTDDLDSGPPARPPPALNTKQGLKSKPESEETQRNAKRVRRT